MVRQEEFLNEKALVVENKFLRVVCLPEFGGKLVSLFDKRIHKEFLFKNPHNAFRHAQTGSDFSSFEACGLDDAFPSVDAGSILVGEALVPYPDHGEIWSAPFSYTTGDDEITLTYTSGLLPYQYEKTYSLDEDNLKIAYVIKNIGQFSFPCIWTLHCLLSYEEGMELILPDDTQEVVSAFASPRLGPLGIAYPYPMAQTPERGVIDFRKVDSPTMPCMEKFYIHHKVTEGLCGVRYCKSNTVLWFEYDETKLPYLGFWKTLGGYRGDFNCALEPTNGFYDTIERARQNEACPELFPGEKLMFSIRIKSECDEGEVKRNEYSR